MLASLLLIIRLLPVAVDVQLLLVLLLSHEILILSMPRLVSVNINGVVARNIWLRFGFNASSGGEVRKFTGGAGTGSKSDLT